jgi:hypothetical protein
VGEKNYVSRCVGRVFANLTQNIIRLEVIVIFADKGKNEE